MRWIRAGLAGAILALAAAAPTRAEAPVVFDVTLRGLQAAVLSFSAREAGGRYAVAGRLESSGLVGLVQRVRFEAEAQGSLRGGRFVPSRYAETADTGRRQSRAVMEYRRGVPQVKSYAPPRDPDEGGLDPATQGGTVDPLTAMYAFLRDRPAAAACNQRLVLFDGERRSQLALGPPRPADGGISCDGEYRRLEGFSAEDMAERTRFPFSLRLEPAAGDLLRVTEVRMQTLFGPAVMARR